MLQMALVWLRLAEYAAKTAARKECAEFINPASVDGERSQHLTGSFSVSGWSTMGPTDI
jgi:hypothetical protein